MPKNLVPYRAARAKHNLAVAARKDAIHKTAFNALVGLLAGDAPAGWELDSAVHYSVIRTKGHRHFNFVARAAEIDAKVQERLEIKAKKAEVPAEAPAETPAA